MVVGAGRPLPIDRIQGKIPPGQFTGGGSVALDAVIAEGVDFSGRRFAYLSAEGSTFIDCDFSRCRFDGGHLDASRTSLFLRCRFDRAKIDRLAFGVSRFEECSFDRMTVDDWWIRAAELVDCRFSGRFSGGYFAAFPEAPYDQPDRMIPWRIRNEFRGNDFSRAELRFPDFRWGVDLSANIWPSEPEYVYLDRWQERLVRATASVGRWEEDKVRERALWWLRFHRSDGRERQEQILFRPSDWADIEPTNTWDRLVELLRKPLG